MPTRIALALTLALALAPPVLAQTIPPAKVPGLDGDQTYTPSVGQTGKDVIWVPTREALVIALLKAAQVKPTDYVVDLGSGDGRFPIIAARDFGARALGIEFNPDMVALAKRNAERAKVQAKATFRQGDIFKTDFRDANVVTLYLLPQLNMQLRPIILAMRPGTRVVSNSFDMGDWPADQEVETDDARGYLWIVPAKVQGAWRFTDGKAGFQATLAQQFQRVSSRGLRRVQLSGDRITVTTLTGRTLTGRVTGDRMEGPGWQAVRAG